MARPQTLAEAFEVMGCCCVGDRVTGQGEHYQEVHLGEEGAAYCDCGCVFAIKSRVPFGSDGSFLPDPFS